MSSDASIIQTLQQAFAKRRRPEHFTDYTHCDECAEHDAMLRSRDIYSLRFQDVGNPGWDPICFITPEGFAYYLPALARLALEHPAKQHDWYGAQLLLHLGSGDCMMMERIRVCTPEQRRAVVAFLHHLVETRSDMADSYLRSDELCRAIERWSGESDA